MLQQRKFGGGRVGMKALPFLGRMAGKRLAFYLALVVLLEVAACKQQYALNVPRVLLPLVASGIRSNFTVSATQGCFTWTSNKPDVASVEAIMEPNGKKACSGKAVVTAQSSQVARLSSVITATEMGGGIVLRCDVFVDTISRIEITTRTRELLLDEEPERFELQALDDEGNTFSTLNGHVVEWQLLSDEEAVHQKEPGAILNFIPFEESTYSTDPAIRRLEAEGLQGETVLVAGISTGSVKVQASLTDKIWKDVPPSVVKLLVIENLMLVPSMDVYILPFSFLHYQVQRRKHGIMEVVPLPSPHHSLHLTNSIVAQLRNSTSRVLGVELGFTEVVLEDHSMLTMPTATKPTAGVHVVYPHHLGFTISPDNVWVLETGREYVINVHIFSKNNHKIYPTQNLPLLTDLPADHLTVHYSSPNGSYHHVTALREGHTHINASLAPLRHPDTGEVWKQEVGPVAKRQQMEIYGPIVVHPPLLVLLWVEEKVEVHYKYLLKASGGSGTYIWTCDPEGVVSMAGNGTLEVLAKGTTTVFAADVRNTAHYNQSEVHVIPPARMEFLSSPVEAEVGTPLVLPLQVLGYIQGENAPADPLPFPDCRHLKIKISFSDSAIFNISNDRGKMEDFPEGACLVLTATAKDAGHTRVIATYESEDIKMEAVVTIAAYKPLVPVDPEVIAVVALGASKLFVFEGGPSPWILDRSKFYKNVTAELPYHIELQPWSTGRVGVVHHVYRITCLRLGELNLDLQVGNGPTSKNLFPATASTSTRLACSLPVSMTLHPVLSNMPDCPLFGRDSNQVMQIPVLCDSSLDLVVEVFDANGRVFDNFTSLNLQWHSSNQELLPLSYPQLHHNGKKAILTVSLGHQSGSVVVMVTCNSHTPSQPSTDPFSPPVRLTTSLLLRQRPQVSPASILLYNHPANRASLAILQGSGYFSVAPAPPNLPMPPASLNYSSKSHEVFLAPRHEGRMMLAMQDLCLEVGLPEWAEIVVGGLYYVEVVGGDKVQVGRSLVVCVMVLDSNHQPFPREQLKLMNLQAYPKTFHITVSPVSDHTHPEAESWPTDSACYTVEGVAVGVAYAAFNATTAEGRVVSSPSKEIQVFDPLDLDPDNITLLPTSTFQIVSSGGPKPQLTVLYSISNETVATVNSSGLILALEPGVTVVTGRVQYTDPSFGGQEVIFSEDTVLVTVVRLTGVKIHLPVTRLLSGVTQAIYAVGLNDELPFTFSSAIPGLAFLWSVTNMDSLAVLSVYDNSGISIQEEQEFDAVLHTRNPGQGAVRLVMKCPPKVCYPNQASFTDEVRVQVVDPLRLLRPQNGHLLLPHHGRARILSNRDGLSMLSYQVLNGCLGSKVSGEGENIISVGRNGEVSALAVNGHAVVKVTESGTGFGLNQTLIVHVEVQQISSLSISPLSVAQATTNSTCHAFPLGYSAVFIADLHDNMGRKFDYAEVPLSHRLSRLDTVLVSPESGNSTYIVKATRQGDVVLKIWVSSHAHVADYTRVRVAYAIIPSLGVVHLGATVCFTTHLLEDQTGEWQVGEGPVMGVASDSGVGRALTVGRTVVYHKMDDVIDSHTEITVTKVDRAELGIVGENLPVFTNGRRVQSLGEYQVPVVFFHDGNTSFTPLFFSSDKRCVGQDVGVARGVAGTHLQQVAFDCQLELSDREGLKVAVEEYVSAEAAFDASSGASFCRLLPRESNMVEDFATRDDLQMRLKVVAGDFSRSYFVASDKVNVPFVPAFRVGRRDVHLSARNAATEVPVTGLKGQLQALKVTSPYPISVVRSSLNASSAVYNVALLPGYYPPDQQEPVVVNVSFSSPLAQQEELVKVYLLDSDQACDNISPNLLPTQFPEFPEKETPEVSKHPPSFLAATVDHFPLIVFVVVLFSLLLLMVVCVALQKTSSGGSGSGFKQHLQNSNVSTIGSQPFQSPSAAGTQYSPGISSAASPYNFTGGVASTGGTVGGGSGKGVTFTSTASYLGTGAGMTTPQQTFNSMPRRRMQSSASPKQPGLFS